MQHCKIITKEAQTVIQYIQGGPKNRVHRLMTIILSNLNRFTKYFSLKDSLVNLQLNVY